MKIFADLHNHSKYSRATSKEMNLEGLSKNAKLKGLNLLGTSDFTFKLWLNELKKKLEPIEGTGLFRYGDVFWMLTTEVSTIYMQDEKVRKVHHVIHASSFDAVDQINDSLSKYGNLSADGRPIVKISSPELVETLIGIDKDILIVPAHIWTSWYGILGEFSGFNSIEECYQDQTKHIHALETGMSSDPPMNWRLSALDKFTLVSNSDSHSPWIWRLGRECNVFELKEVSYKQIMEAIKKKDKNRFLFTIETSPSYGKYHFTGHRSCGINLNPENAIKFNNICPKCGRKLTIGVLQRVEKLADRQEGFVPKDAIPFKDLLPLYEIISHVTGVNQLYSGKVIEEQNKLIQNFGTEFNILLEATQEELEKVTDKKIAEAIIKTREGNVKYIAGYDGVYGRPFFSEEEFKKAERQQEIKVKEQKRLVDFKGP